MRAKRKRKRHWETMYLLTKRVLTWGSTDTEKEGGASPYVCLFCCCSSESEGIDHPHYHYVPDGGDDGDPEPDGIAGHGLRLVLLAMCGRRRCGGVDAGRGVEEWVFAAVVVVGRGVHEGSCHHGDLRHNVKTVTYGQPFDFQQNLHEIFVCW